MKWLALVYVAVILCQSVLCWRTRELLNTRSGNTAVSGYGEDARYKDDRRLLDYLRDVKRTNWLEALCGKWDDWCMPETGKPGLTCCNGYTCKCNLWNTNCRCKSKLFKG